MFFFFKKSRPKRKRNKFKIPKKDRISQEQMDAIFQTIMRKKRLMVYVENF